MHIDKHRGTCTHALRDKDEVLEERWGHGEPGLTRTGTFDTRRPGPGLEWGVREGSSRAGWPAVGVRCGPLGEGCGVGEKGRRLGPAASTRTGAGTRGHRGEVGGPSVHASVLALPLAVVLFCHLALCNLSPLQGELPEDRNLCSSSLLF